VHLAMLQPGESAAIVGGSGFIGSRLALALLENGADVTVLDIAPPPKDLLGRCRYAFCEISDRESLCGLLVGHSSLFLLAALLAKGCRENPLLGWRTNVIGVANVLEALATESPRARVVFMSTGGIYARHNTYPTIEQAAKHCDGLYASSKLAGEAMVHSYTKALGASAVILRFFTVYGPGPATGARGHFIASCIERMRARLPLTVHGDGEQTIDLTHVSDVVRACRLAMYASINPGEARTYNIGSGTETSVRKMADWMQEYDPSTSIVLQPEMHDYGPRRQFGDIRRARQDLGYVPFVKPREGLLALLSGQFLSRDLG
jgi:UDP-glucose 4-epimerase